MNRINRNWINGLQLRHRHPPVAVRQWLTDPASLTAKLVELSNGHFRVKVLRQNMDSPSLDERAILGTPERQQAIIREVLLHGNGQPWVYARSVLPTSSLTGANRKLGMLGEKPLGAALFADPMLKRNPMQYCRCRMKSDNLGLQGNNNDLVELWGRRSLFTLRGKPILVAEYFLPDFFQAIGNSNT